MPAVGQKIVMWVGDDLVITIPVKDNLGNWVDLTGATAKWFMGKSVKATGANVYIEKSSLDSGGDLEIIPVSGSEEWDLVITIHPIDTEHLRAGKFYHEVKVIDGYGKYSTVMTGIFQLMPTLIKDNL